MSKLSKRNLAKLASDKKSSAKSRLTSLTIDERETERTSSMQRQQPPSNKSQFNSRFNLVGRQPKVSAKMRVPDPTRSQEFTLVSDSHEENEYGLFNDEVDEGMKHEPQIECSECDYDSRLDLQGKQTADKAKDYFNN